MMFVDYIVMCREQVEGHLEVEVCPAKERNEGKTKQGGDQQGGAAGLQVRDMRRRQEAEPGGVELLLGRNEDGQNQE